MSAGPPCSTEPDHRRDEADQDGQLGDRQAAERALRPLALAAQLAPAALDSARSAAWRSARASRRVEGTARGAVPGLRRLRDLVDFR